MMIVWQKNISITLIMKILIMNEQLDMHQVHKVNWLISLTYYTFQLTNFQWKVLSTQNLKSKGLRAFL